MAAVFWTKTPMMRCSFGSWGFGHLSYPKLTPTHSKHCFAHSVWYHEVREHAGVSVWCWVLTLLQKRVFRCASPNEFLSLEILPPLDLHVFNMISLICRLIYIDIHTSKRHKNAPAPSAVLDQDLEVKRKTQMRPPLWEFDASVADQEMGQMVADSCSLLMTGKSGNDCFRLLSIEDEFDSGGSGERLCDCVPGS